MRIALLALAVLCTNAAACETQRLLGRCQSTLDCDRNVAAPASRCVPIATRSGECRPDDPNCICCPTTLPTDPNDPVLVACMMRIAPVDAMPTDAVDDGADALTSEAGGDGASGDVVDAGPAEAGTDAPLDASCACVEGVQYCDNGTCRARRPLGASCAIASECLSSYCVGAAPSAVCCNVVCAASGYACNVPGLEGQCTFVAGPDAAMMTDAAAD